MVVLLLNPRLDRDQDRDQAITVVATAAVTVVAMAMGEYQHLQAVLLVVRIFW